MIGSQQDMKPTSDTASASSQPCAPELMISGDRPSPPRTIMTFNNFQLDRCENAWMPKFKRGDRAKDPQVQQTEKLLRNVQSILNKLTPQKFDQLKEQVMELKIDTEERLQGVVDLIYEKAIDEPNFSTMYANLCHCLATVKVQMSDKPNRTVKFCRLLLNCCQKEFERNKMDDEAFERKQKELQSAESTAEREWLQQELEDARNKARRRSMGNMKLIGELFKLKMLTRAVVHKCVQKLLENNDEESLECVCRLLTTVGKELDEEQTKTEMDQFFSQMDKIAKERKTSSRIRFMLQDVLELRSRTWVSRRADQGPKTIQQVHEEAEMEEQEEHRKALKQLFSEDSGRQTGTVENPGEQWEETRITVLSTTSTWEVDVSKLPKTSKQSQLDDEIQLRPPAHIIWTKGCKGWTRTKDTESSHRASALLSSPTPPSSTTPPRRFSAGRERGQKPLFCSSSRSSSFNRSKKLSDRQKSEELSRKGAKLKRTSDPKEMLDMDFSRVRELVKVEPVAPTTDISALSEEAVEKKSKSIIKEFLHMDDDKEAVECVDELDLGPQINVFVRVSVELTLEHSQRTRERMGELLYQLVQRGILPKDQFYKGFADMLEKVEDMAVDVPHIWLYLAELLSPLLKDGGFSMMELFSKISKPLLPAGGTGILISKILHVLSEQMSHQKVASLWRESGLSWPDVLPEGEDVQTFISQQRLQFLQPDSSGPEEAPSPSSSPSLEFFDACFEI